MKQIQFKELCEDLSKEELIQLIHYLNETYAGIDFDVVEWYTRYKGLNKTAVQPNTLLLEYWNKAEDIIHEFNTYGGGPEHLEYEACEYMDKARDIALEYPILSDEKRELINRAFKQYAVGNSGFDDFLMDFIWELCNCDDDWRHFVKLLRSEPSRWNEEKIMRIYKGKLNDEAAYLELRYNSLRYGMDYWDLADFYIQQGDTTKAISIVQDGLRRGEGRITELLQYAARYYEGQNDIEKLEDIVHIAFERGSDVFEIGTLAFRYFQRCEMYEQAKDVLLKLLFQEYNEKPYYTLYDMGHNDLRPDDWSHIEASVLQLMKKNSMYEYLKVCSDKGMHKEILDILLAADTYMSDRLDEYADKIAAAYPREIAEYYWDKGRSFIPNGSRKSYKKGIIYFQKAKEIYLNMLQEEASWTERLERLKQQHRNKRAFLEEMRVV